MKYQDLFSLKNYKIKNKYRLLQILLGALRVKDVLLDIFGLLAAVHFKYICIVRCLKRNMNRTIGIALDKSLFYAYYAGYLFQQTAF